MINHNNNRHLRLLLGIIPALLLFLIGCQATAGEAPPTLLATAPPVTLLPTPTAATSPTPASPVTSSPLPPTVTPPPAADVAPLAGLVFDNQAGLWMINTQGEPVQLTDTTNKSYFWLEPSGQRLLYLSLDQQEIWLEDLETGETRHLTDVPANRQVRAFQWWPARPDIIAFTSVPAEAGFWSGDLSLLNLADGAISVLVTEIDAYALSPDGQTIAYAQNAEPWLYHWHTGAAPLPVDVSTLGITTMVNPAWSPDGKELAWIGLGHFLPGESDMSDMGTVVINMETQTPRLIHPYTPLAGSEIYANVQWSPDGKWLTPLYQAELPDSRISRWLLRADGQEEVHLGSSGSFVWHPKGHQMLLQQWVPATNESNMILFEIEAGHFEEVAWENGRLIAWLPLE